MQQSVARPVTPEQSVGGPREWEFIFERMIGKAYTITLVKVVDVKSGGTGAVGFVSATDLLQQVDGSNNGIPNVPMENLPYFRLQGGANAVIIDPKPGDIGLAAFARRDITVTKQSKQEGPPPSLRAHDVSDGIYIGGVLNGAPNQYIQFRDGGILVHSPSNVTLEAPAITARGNVSVSTGATGSFTTPTGTTVTVQDGIVTNIF